MARALDCRHTHQLGFHCRWILIVTFMLVAGAAQAGYADSKSDSAADPFRYRSGVRNSLGRYQVKPKHLSALVESLRAKTGYVELHFDEDGFLTLGDRAHVAGGSVMARNLVQAAVDGPQALIIEDHSASRGVTFARLTSSLIYQNLRTGQNMEARMLQVDFNDFGSLKGERDVLAAFDVGFVVLHELAHGALGLSDAVSEEEEPGDCENYINQIRRQLNLPERLNYYARYRLGTSPLGLSQKRAELAFARTVNKGGRNKSEQLYLNWNSMTVGESSITHREPTTPSRMQTTATL